MQGKCKKLKIKMAQYKVGNTIEYKTDVYGQISDKNL